MHPLRRRRTLLPFVGDAAWPNYGLRRMSRDVQSSEPRLARYKVLRNGLAMLSPA